jgi:hypothetical protein
MESIKAPDPISREGVWSEALVEKKVALSGERGKSARRETQGYWGVGISLMQPCPNLTNCLKGNTDPKKRWMI